MTNNLTWLEESRWLHQSVMGCGASVAQSDSVARDEFTLPLGNYTSLSEARESSGENTTSSTKPLQSRGFAYSTESSRPSEEDVQEDIEKEIAAGSYQYASAGKQSPAITDGYLDVPVNQQRAKSVSLQALRSGLRSFCPKCSNAVRVPTGAAAAKCGSCGALIMSSLEPTLVIG